MDWFMAAATFKFRDVITVIVRMDGGYRLRAIPAGSVFIADVSQPDANSMVDGTCGGADVMVFARDLAERAEPLEGELVFPGR